MGKRAIEISGELWQEWLTVGWSIGHPDKIECIEGLPEGAKFCSAYYENRNGLGEMPILVLIFERPEWPELAEGAMVPTIRAEYGKFYREED